MTSDQERAAPARQPVSPSDPQWIIAGIRQFGLAPDGSDLRDLEAALARSEPELRAEIVSLQAEVERLTPLAVAYDYLEAPDAVDWKARVEALSAEVGKLTEALKPFAREAEYWHGNAPIHIDLGCSESREAEFTPADLRRARDCLRSRAALDKGATE